MLHESIVYSFVLLRGAWIREMGPVLHPHPLGLGIAHSKASAGFPVPLPSGVTLDEPSAAVRQKWQAEVVRAGAPWGRQRGSRREHTEGGRAEGPASALGAKVLCYGMWEWAPSLWNFI